MACFADINVSQGSVATYAGCGEIFNIHLTANLIRNLPVKKFVNRLRFDRIMMWQPAETCRNTVTAVACRVTHRLCQISPIIVCQGQACFGCWTDSVTDGSWAAHQNNWISCFDSKCLTARELKGERKCADTVGTVLVQKASWLAVSNAKNIFFKQNIRKQFYRTALGNCYALKLPKCWLQLKNKFVVLFIIMFGTLSFPGGIRELEFWTHAFQWQCSQRTNWLSTNRPSFAADNRLVTPMPNSHRQARPDKTALSVSRPLRRCELYSRQLKTVAARKSEVWTR